MDYINAIIFGAIQGITEFLPISSSGHLVVLHQFLSIPVKDELVFDVILHLATLVAVVWCFWDDIKNLAKGLRKPFSGNQESKKLWLIVLATIPAATAGFFLENLIEFALRDIWVVITMLILVGFLFIIIEKLNKKNQDLKSLDWKKALLIGFAQSIALIPGTSRSGITIITGIFVGLKREAAIKFSFLLSIPIIAGASLVKAPNIISATYSADEIIVLVIAFVSSLISGFLTIKFFLKFAQNHSLASFAYYRFALAFVLILLSLT